MLRNLDDDMYWKVGDKIFYSKLLAMDESLLSNRPITFHFYDKWLSGTMGVDVTQHFAWDDLLLERALEIRQKWKFVRLWYSGGRDSYLALQSFIKNNIIIDELVVIDYSYRHAEYPYIYEDLVKNEYHLKYPIKKISLKRFDLQAQEALISKNWHLKNNNTTFVALPPLSEFVNYFYPEHKDWCNVTGCEKPRVMCDQGKMYFSMNDGTPQTLIGIYNHEPFYVSPNVPIFQYQTWYLVNYILATPELKSVSDHELNMGLNTIPKNPWDQTSLYYHGCRGSLRNSFASFELGLPLGKAFQTDYAVKIGLARYEDIEQIWSKFYPEINKAFRNGMLEIDEAYSKFHQSNNVKYQPKKIHSKRHYLRDR